MLDMRRRDFVSLLGGAAVTWPLAARAQQPTMPVIGFLHSASPEGWEPMVAAFRAGLNETGFVEGQNVAIEFRWAAGQYDRLPALAAELVHRQVAVIATGGTISALAARTASTTIPIVFTMGGDPVELGLVASLNRPGGNATGVSYLLNMMVTKQFELLHELIPKAAAIAFLVNPTNANAESDTRAMQAAAEALRRQLVILKAATEHGLETTFAPLSSPRVGALVVSADAFFLSQRDRLIAITARHSLPAVYPVREYSVAGGLMSYGGSPSTAFRQAANYIGKILKGAKPADLPVIQPTKFEFVINLQTARTLGIEVPPGLLAIANAVIE
jgi:putative tryptophan/tyrosine transport system substrate-binding protein